MKLRHLLLAGSLLLLTASLVFPKTTRGSWLRGSWEGTGYQTDDASVWPMRLTIIRTKRGNPVFSIDYPSLNCGGKWKLQKRDKNNATFREQLEHGQDKCTDNGMVFIERKGNKQIVYLYALQGSHELTASAILNRVRH